MSWGKKTLKKYTATLSEGKGKYQWEGRRDFWGSSDVQASRKAREYAGKNGLKVKSLRRKP